MTPLPSGNNSFFESELCKSHRSCVVCRAREAGRAWRRMISRVHNLAVIDYTCPHGRAWSDGKEAGIENELSLRQLDYVIEHRGEIYIRLPGGHSISHVIKTIIGMLSSKQGCTSCRKNRVRRTLSTAYRGLAVVEQIQFKEVCEFDFS